MLPWPQRLRTRIELYAFIDELVRLVLAFDVDILLGHELDLDAFAFLGGRQGQCDGPFKDSVLYGYRDARE